MEMFIIPATYNLHTGNRDWANLNGADTEDILLQSQTKSRKVVPSRGFSFFTKNPKIVKTGFMPGKGNSTASTTETYLGKAPWLSNGKGPHADPAVTHPDQRDVLHYGYTVLVTPSPPANSNFCYRYAVSTVNHSPTCSHTTRITLGNSVGV
jgi:hypothetical protein